MSLSLPTLSTFTFPISLPIQKSIEASTTGQTSQLSHEELIAQVKQFYEQRRGQALGQGQQKPSQPVPLPTPWLVLGLEAIEKNPQSVQTTTTRIKRSTPTDLPAPKTMTEIRSHFPQEVDEKRLPSQAEDTVFEQDMSAPEHEESDYVDTSWALRKSIFAKKVNYDRITQEVGKMLDHVQHIFEQKTALALENTPSLNRAQVELHLLKTLQHSSGISLHLEVDDIDGMPNTYDKKHHVNPPGAKTLAQYCQDAAKELSEHMVNEMSTSEGEIDILRMDLQLEYPNLNVVKPISPRYIHAFNIKSTHDPDVYAHTLSEAGIQDLKRFFASLSKELADVGGNIHQSPTFTAAAKNLVAHYQNNGIVKEENTALEELVRVYYQAMSENLKTQQHLLLNTLPTQMEFVAKALCEQLSVDKKYWPVLAKQKFYIQLRQECYSNGELFGDSKRYHFVRLSDQAFAEAEKEPKTLLEILYDENFRNKVGQQPLNGAELSDALAQYLKIPEVNRQTLKTKINRALFEQQQLLVYNIGPSNEGLSVTLRQPTKSYTNTFLPPHIAQRVKDYIALETERVILTSSNAIERLQNHEVSQPLNTLLTEQERQTIQARSHHFKTALNDVTNHDDYRGLSTSGQHVFNITRQVAGYLPVVGPFLSLALDIAAGDEDAAAFDAFFCLTMFIPQSGELGMLKKLIDVGVNGAMGVQAVKSALQARDSDALAAALFNIGLLGHALSHSGVSLAHWRASEGPHENINNADDKPTETLLPTPEDTHAPSEESHSDTRPTYALPLSDIEGLRINEEDGTYHDPANGKQYIQIQDEEAYVYEVVAAPHEPQLMQIINPATRNKRALIQRNKDGNWEKIGLKGGGGFQSTHKRELSPEQQTAQDRSKQKKTKHPQDNQAAQAIQHSFTTLDGAANMDAHQPSQTGQTTQHAGVENAQGHPASDLIVSDHIPDEIVIDDEGNILSVSKSQTPTIKNLVEVNNRLPILRDPKDPQKSLTFIATGLTAESTLENLKVSNWGKELHDLFQQMPIKQKQMCQKNLKQAFLRQIQGEGTEEEANRMKSLIISQASRHPVENSDDVIDLGTGIFNPGPNPIEPFTVLGAFAGIHLNGDDAIKKKRRKIGSVMEVTYSWQTSSSKRGVSAARSGNILRYINTAQLPKSPAIAEENNVTSVLVNQEIVFYVTTKTVQPGEEYFISYGNRYNPQEHINEASAMVKPEPK